MNYGDEEIAVHFATVVNISQCRNKIPKASVAITGDHQERLISIAYDYYAFPVPKGVYRCICFDRICMVMLCAAYSVFCSRYLDLTTVLCECDRNSVRTVL